MSNPSYLTSAISLMKVNEEHAKKKLFALVSLFGLDIDGDLMSDNGISYYVNARANTVEVVSATK